MNEQTFSVQCPNCLAVFDLDVNLKGRRIGCPSCRRAFVLNERQDVPSERPTRTSKNESSLVSDLSRSKSQFSPPDKLKEKYSNFPEPPAGVWKVGTTLLDGLCQVLPLSPTKFYGEGGVGLVQRVHRRDWNADLIVKSPKPGVVAAEFGKQSFEKECQTWIELGLHANVVSCYFVRRIDGIPRLFAELAPDGTLQDWIADKRIYAGSPREALARIFDMSIQFAWGLEYAHRQGLLHLDVKPGNVMVSGSTVKVTDFGLSKFVKDSSENGALSAGVCDGLTPSYCSPEQFKAYQLYREFREKGGLKNGKCETVPMTKQSDIWSWAISVLAMFHGRSPCKVGGQTAAEVFEVFLNAPKPESRPIMPGGMIELLRWCFRQAPEERPASMQLVADQLCEIYQDEFGERFPRRQPQNTLGTAESMSNRAVSLLDLGKIDDATALFRRAAENAPRSPYIVYNNILSQWRAGRILDSQAIQRLENLKRIRPRDPQAYYVLGLAQLERGNLKSAVSAFERSLEILPTQDFVREELERVEALEPFDVQCRANYALSRPDDQTPPTLMIDESGDLLLLELNEGKRALLNADNGQILTRFTQGKKVGSSRPRALSDDYRWNLSFDEDEAFLESALNDSKDDARGRRRFVFVDWNVLRVRRVRASNSLFTPQPNYAAFVKDGDFANEVRLVDEEQRLTALATTPEGSWAATGGDESLIRLWDVKHRRCARTFVGSGGVVEALWIDPKRRFILSLTNGNACQYWSVAILCRRSEKVCAPRLLCQINSSEELQERREKIDSILKDARDAEAKNDVETLVRLFGEAEKIEGGESAREFFERALERRASRSGVAEIVQTSEIVAHDSAISALAPAWNGAFFATGGKDCAIRVWASVNSESEDENCSESWKQTCELTHADWVRSIALSPNQRFLASGSWDQTVALWDLATGRKISKLPEKIRSVSKVAFAPDGRTLAVATANGTVSLWNLARNRELIRMHVGSGGVRSLVFRRDGRFLATCAEDKTIRIWNGRSELPKKEIGGLPANVLALDWSYDGRTLVAGCADGKIYLIDPTNDSEKTRRSLAGHLGEVGVVKLFPESRWLVSAGRDGTFRVWDLRELREVAKVRSMDGEILDLAVDLAGTSIFTGAEKGVARKWSIRWNYAARDASLDPSKLLASLNDLYRDAGEATETSASFLRYGDKNFEAERERSVARSYPPQVWEKSKAEARYCGFVDL